MLMFYTREKAMCAEEITWGNYNNRIKNMPDDNKQCFNKVGRDFATDGESQLP